MNQKRYCEAIIRLILAFIVCLETLTIAAVVFRDKALEPPQVVIRAIRPSPVVYAAISTATPEQTPAPTPKGIPEVHMTYAGTFTATAYSADYECCGKYPDDPAYGITASGTTATEGRTIAADWDVLPEGTKVYVEGIGKRTVEDRGGGVSGNYLDIFYDSYDDAVNWGVREVKVWIISP